MLFISFARIVPTFVLILSLIRIVCLEYHSDKYLYFAINIMFLMILAVSSVICIVDRIRLR